MISQDLAEARQTEYVAEVVPETQPAAVGLATTDGTGDDDHAAYIARMQEKLARGEGDIPGAPIVFTSVDSVPASSSASVPVSERSVAWCTAPYLPHPIGAEWDAREIEIRSAEGARIVTRGTVDVASSSDAVIPDVLLQLPMRMVRAGSDTCVPYDVIGVALDGSLIRNSDAPRYASTGEYTLIGYALDGFPIYGPVASGVHMDACGGTDTPTGYQYHVRANEDFILGCFAAPPAQFLQ